MSAPAAASSGEIGSAVQSAIDPGSDDASAQGSTSAQEPDQVDDAVGDADLTAVICYLFAPEYTPVEVQVDVSLPVETAPFLTSVAAARPPDALPFFPQLRPVHPQPDPTYVSLLAVPQWPTAGVPVLLHVLGDVPRTFADYLPAVVSHDGVLNCACVTPRWGYRVFVRDLPWPIPAHGTVPIEPGDLLTIAPPGPFRIPRLSLADILQWTYGWAQIAEPPGHWPGGTWLLSDAFDAHAFARLPSGRLSAAVVADALALDPAALVMHPTVPHITDHARRGRVSDGVCLAVDPSTHPLPEAVLYTLDLRPVLLPLVVMHAQDGIVDVASLHGRLVGRCPPGFFVRILGGESSPRVANHYRVVAPGDVITAFFQVRRETVLDTPSVSPVPSEVAGPAASTSSSDAYHIDGSSHAPSRDAGTGGSHQRPLDGGYRHGCSSCDAALDALCADFYERCCLLYVQDQARVMLLLWLHSYVDAAGVLLRHCLQFLARRALRVWQHCWLACVVIWIMTLPGLTVGMPIPDPIDEAVSAIGGRSAIVPRSSLLAIPRPLVAASEVCRPPGQAALSLCSPPVVGHGPDLADSSVNRDFAGDMLAFELSGLTTLLEVAALQPTCQAYFLAATLLDALEEHFYPTASHGPIQPLQLSLATALPLSLFQRQCLTLQDLLPPAVCPAQVPDWLDNDLTPVLHFPDAALTLRTQLVNVPLWHALPQTPPASRLEVYTDGSALGVVEPLRSAPGGWAFSVWVTAGAQTFYYGSASGTSVPPHTPFDPGELSRRHSPAV